MLKFLHCSYFPYFEPFPIVIVIPTTHAHYLIAHHRQQSTP